MSSAAAAMDFLGVDFTLSGQHRAMHEPYSHAEKNCESCHPIMYYA